MPTPDLITVIGPTASGKTSFAAALAYELNGEIISGDSRQIYRRMNIGTGKDLSDYVVNGRQIPYHLIDIREPGYKYNVCEFQQDFIKAYNDIKKRNKLPILCGGTGMYVEAVLKGYKLVSVPENKELRNELEKKSLEELIPILQTYKTLHNTTDVDTARRAVRAIEIEEYYRNLPPEYNHFPVLNGLIVELDIPRDERRARITKRLHDRLSEGMVEEVENLLSSGVSPDSLIYYGLEYKFITLYLIGQINYNQMVAQLEIAIHQFAKRQMTWFRGMETRGLTVYKIDALLPTDEKVKACLNRMLNLN